MLELNRSVLVLVDVQGRLAELMHGRGILFANLVKTVRGARALGLPVLWMEQNPARMGPTLPQIRKWLDGVEPIPKMAFSCWGEKRFRDTLESCQRNQVLIAGIEAHVCVQQTAADLVENGYDAFVIEDAVSSRLVSNHRAGVAMAVAHGARKTTVEAFLFELMRTAEHPAFKEVLKLVK